MNTYNINAANACSQNTFNTVTLSKLNARWQQSCDQDNSASKFTVLAEFIDA